jgi:AraC-like DNA-binding protein
LKALLDQLAALIIAGGILQGLFVTLLLNNGQVKKSRANVFLSVLLIALSFSTFHIMFAGRVINHFSVKVFNAGDPSFLLIAPLLWFYVKELTGSKVSFSLKSSLHFIPFFLIICISLLFRFVPANNSTKLFLLEHSRFTSMMFWILVVVQFSFYHFLIRRRWLVYQQVIEQEISNTEDVNISWVRFFMSVFLLINFLFLMNLFVVIHLENIFWLERTTAVIFSLSIFALGYKGILQREIFYTRFYKAVAEIKVASIPIKVVENRPEQELINRLLLYMEEKKPYLDPELTLSDLAKQTQMSRNQLSQVINDGIGDNFYNFINKYRVEQVKKFMTESTMKHFSMLGLALEAGFKSKSTFNLIFKRFTGLTPTEYSKNITQ